MTNLLSISGSKPRSFKGEILLPPSKSYLHRALFVSSLLNGHSEIKNCGTRFSDDVKATFTFLRSLGVKIRPDGVSPERSLAVNATGRFEPPRRSVFLGGSGTTARFAISFAALADDQGETRITGNDSLSKRPMEALLEALRQLGVMCKSEKNNGCLPVLVRGGGIPGGSCKIDGSISSQFISSLIIGCTRATNDTEISISDSSRLVSEPYIDATLKVLKHYGFNVTTRRGNGLRYRIRAGQKGKRGVTFSVPGDMSSASAIIGSAICAGGSIKLLGVNPSLPQPDADIIQIAKMFGASVKKFNGSIQITSGKVPKKLLRLDLKQSPDLVPAVFGTSAGLGIQLKITNVGQLRFKESDRIHTLAKQFSRLDIKTTETNDSISIIGKKATTIRRKPIFLEPENDHRMLMAFTIAGLSGSLGKFYINDPECVNKSYPGFISDLQRLMGEKATIRIVKKERMSRN